MKRIMVTGAGGPAAHNFMDSLRLAEEEFYIVGTDVSGEHLELSGADRKYVVPSVEDASYADVINRIIAKEKIQFLHPQPDTEVAFISENREKFATRTMLPAKETVRVCQDKMTLISLLREKGIPAPESVMIENENDIRRELRNNGTLWLRAVKGAGSRASLPVKEASHAVMWIDYWSKMKGIGYGQFMLSEFLPGRDYAFQSIWNDGQIVTSQARERLEYVFGNLTVSGQSSSPSIARTIRREDVNRIATKAIQAVDERATGIFCVDMKENSEGVPCVTEINLGRFFTTSNFFAHAGCNMPYYFVKMALGEEIPDLPTYDALPEDMYWVRAIDCGYKLIRGYSDKGAIAGRKA